MMEKVINFRDLGGLVNLQGQRIYKGKLFRSANPCVGSAKDCGYLQNLKLDEIVDFRSIEEKRNNEQFFTQQFNCVAKPIFTGNIVELINEQLDSEQAKSAMCMVYKRFPVDFKQEFRYLLKLAEQSKVLLYHCTEGKDRTGFATFLLLSALGVAEQSIMDEYLLSNEVVSILKQQLADLLEGFAPDADIWEAFLSVYPVYLETAIAVINKQYGGVYRYLTDTLGIDIRAIRQHYLEN